jgi:signal transduction histidine kinase
VRGPVERDLRKVRLRTTAVATFVLVTILVVAGYLLADRFERELMRQVDDRLALSTDYVARVGASDERFPPIGTATDLVQVVDSQGDIVYGSPALRTDATLWTPGSGERGPHTVSTRDDGELRVRAGQFRDRWVVFGTSLASVDDEVRTLERAMLVGLPPLAMALALLVWVVVGRTLRPVAAAVEREERLVADVSHELRSPLAGLRVLLETEPTRPQQVELSRIEALAALGRLETITDQLLALMRHDQADARVPGHPVDLDELVLDRVATLAPRSPVPIDTGGVGAGQVVGREDALVSLVENLLTNAVRHARAAVRVTVTEEAGTVELAVDDDGPGIAPEDRDHIFERFTRLDEARSRDQGGTGLGLAIVRAVAEPHGGTVAVADSDLGGARFTVQLPASTPAPDAAPAHGDEPPSRPRSRT